MTVRPLIRSLTATALVAFLILLPACNKTEWVARWADTYIAWKINHQFDFSGDAKKTVKSESERLVKDFRKKQFPKMAQSFFAWSKELGSLEFSQEDKVKIWVTAKTAQSEEFLDALRAELEPFALNISSQVGAENWQSFLKDFEKENSRILKDKGKCAGKMADEIEEWLGSLNSSQQAAIEKYCQTRKDSQEVRVKNRQHLLQTFQNWSHPNGSNVFRSSEFQAATQKWLKNYKSIQSPESQEKWKISRQQLIESMTQILVNSSESQRKRLREKLESDAQNLQRLSL